jgi:hypothetical protein
MKMKLSFTFKNWRRDFAAIHLSGRRSMPDLKLELFQDLKFLDFFEDYRKDN